MQAYVGRDVEGLCPSSSPGDLILLPGHVRSEHHRKKQHHGTHDILDEHVDICSLALYHWSQPKMFGDKQPSAYVDIYIN